MNLNCGERSHLNEVILTRAMFCLVLPENKSLHKNVVLVNPISLPRSISELYFKKHRAGIAQSVQRRATAWTLGVRFPEGAILFLISVQTGFGVHPAFYPMGTWSSFPGGKEAGA
jgi:hypothetical protein